MEKLTRLAPRMLIIGGIATPMIGALLFGIFAADGEWLGGTILLIVSIVLIAPFFGAAVIIQLLSDINRHLERPNGDSG